MKYFLRAPHLLVAMVALAGSAMLASRVARAASATKTASVVTHKAPKAPVPTKAREGTSIVPIVDTTPARWIAPPPGAAKHVSPANIHSHLAIQMHTKPILRRDMQAAAVHTPPQTLSRVPRKMPPQVSDVRPIPAKTEVGGPAAGLTARAGKAKELTTPASSDASSLEPQNESADDDSGPLLLVFVFVILACLGGYLYLRSYRQAKLSMFADLPASPYTAAAGAGLSTTASTLPPLPSSVTGEDTFPPRGASDAKGLATGSGDASILREKSLKNTAEAPPSGIIAKWKSWLASHMGPSSRKAESKGRQEPNPGTEHGLSGTAPFSSARSSDDGPFASSHGATAIIRNAVGSADDDKSTSAA